MKITIINRFVVCVALSAGLLMAQVIVYQKPSSFTAEYQVKPQLVPTSPTDIVTTDAYLTGGTLSSDSTAGTCTISDKQGSPLPALKAVSLAANTIYVIPFTNRWMPGGITWSCSSATVTGYLSFRQ